MSASCSSRTPKHLQLDASVGVHSVAALFTEYRPNRVYTSTYNSKRMAVNEDILHSSADLTRHIQQHTAPMYGYDLHGNDTELLMTVNDTNATSQTAMDHDVTSSDFLIMFFKALAMILVISTAIIGNLLVIISVFKFKNLHIISNSFIVSLAFADLLVAMLVMPFNASQELAGRWLFGQIVCDVFNANDVLFSTASLLHLCCISMDRYIAITDPFHYEQRMTKKKVALMLCIVWGASGLISHIPVHTGIYTDAENRLISYNPDDPHYGLCLFLVNDVYAIISSTVSFWIPTGIMLATYALVFREARRQEKQIMKLSTLGSRSNAAFQSLQPNARDSVCNGLSPPQNGNGYSPSQPRRLSKENKIKREHKAAKTLGIIMSAFLLCWLPFFLWYVITTLCGDNCPYPNILVSILFWIGYINSALNPVIYAFCNKEFNRAFKSLLQFNSIRRLCTNYCCVYCVRRGWIRRASDQESNYLAGLPPARRSRDSRPSIAPSLGMTRQNSVTSANVGMIRNNSAYSGFSRANYETVPEVEAL